MSRLEIKNNLLQTSCILGLIEMYPETSDIFDSALNGRYKKMQESLSQFKNFLATDYFYSSDNVFDKIRSKNLQQYVAPYKVLDMRDIASAFQISLEQVEKEIVEQITAGNIKCKIDGHKKILFARTVNTQLETYQKACLAGEKCI